jgi:molybdopterin-guanine dinucleotide biosynthesis protein A
MRDPTSIELAGIFVGGQSTRMEGRPKGLLLAPTGETLVQRWLTLFAQLGIESVLVGQQGAYRGLGLEQLADDPPGIGPLGGLIALLSRARGGDVIAVACDMPHVSLDLLERLSTFAPGASAVAAQNGDRWEPLFARYCARVALGRARERAATGEHSLQGLLTDLAAEALPLTRDEIAQLRDWDTPDDVTPTRPSSTA